MQTTVDLLGLWPSVDASCVNCKWLSGILHHGPSDNYKMLWMTLMPHISFLPPSLLKSCRSVKLISEIPHRYVWERSLLALQANATACSVAKTRSIFIACPIISHISIRLITVNFVGELLNTWSDCNILSINIVVPISHCTVQIYWF